MMNEEAKRRNRVMPSDQTDLSVLPEADTVFATFVRKLERLAKRNAMRRMGTARLRGRIA